MPYVGARQITFIPSHRFINGHHLGATHLLRNLSLHHTIMAISLLRTYRRKSYAFFM